MTDDEELPDRPGRDTRRLRIDLGIGALALVATLLVAKALAHHNSGKPHSTGVATPGVTGSSGPSHSSSPTQPTGVQATVYCPPADDGQVACTTSESVPPAFVAAVRTLLPAASPIREVTYELRDTGPEVIPGIWWRAFTARADGATIRIVVSRGSAPKRVETQTRRGARQVSYVLASQAGSVSYLVEVRVNAPVADAPALTDIVRLATDRRLIRRP